MLEKRALVSIVVPVYNVEKYLDACLWSLRKQIYKNIEVIVVDDVSPDNSMEIARRHASEDSRIRLVSHDVNKKQGAARNTGMSIARGKYLMFLDSDDTYPLDSVYNMVMAIEREDADMVIGKMAWLKSGKVLPVEYIEGYIKNFELVPYNNVRNLPANKWCFGSACHQIYRMEWLQKHAIVFSEGVYWEDVLFSVFCWYHAEKIAYIPDIVYLRTEREDGDNPSTTQEYGMKKYLDRDYLEKAVFDVFFDECKRDGNIKKDAEIVLGRIYSTTKNILAYRNENISQWTEEWFRGYSNRHKDFVKRLVQA